MMKEELLQRLSDIEWEDFEVKEAKSEVPKNVWETVSAFSNTSGGWIIFGIKQSNKSFEITGITNPDKVAQDFLTVLRGEKFNVKFLVESRKHRLEGKTVLLFYIPLSDKKPVYFNTPINTFIRTGNGNQRATSEEIDAMFRDQAFGTQTSRLVSGTSISSLNKLSIERYRDYMTRFNPDAPYNRLQSTELLNKLRVISEDAVTFSGLLFFGNEDAIAGFFPDFRIDYLEIPATDYRSAKPRYTFRLDPHENIWEYYFGIFQRIRRHLDIPFQLTDEGFATEKSPAVDAIREAPVNMLMHTDYFSPAKPRVRVFTDRIEFFNPGALPKPLDIILKEDISMPRNPILAKLFRVVKLAENAGYGFDKMNSGWEDFNNTKPEIETGTDYFKIIFYYKGGVKGGVKGKVKLTPKQEEVLKMIIADPFLSFEKAAEIMRINISAARKHFDKLKEKKVIVRKGPAKGGYWDVLIEYDEEKVDSSRPDIKGRKG